MKPKSKLFILALLCVSICNVGYSQADKFGSYIIASSLQTSLRESAVSGASVIARIVPGDTLIVVSVNADDKYRAYVETVVDGKRGFVTISTINENDNNIVKQVVQTLKVSKDTPAQRAGLAFDYDQLKKNRDSNKDSELPYCTGTDQIEILNSNREVIGKMAEKDYLIVYSMISDKSEKGNGYINDYYRAIWNNQDVLISMNAMVGKSYLSKFVGDMAYIRSSKYIGENVRRKYAMEKYPVLVAEQEKIAKERITGSPEIDKLLLERRKSAEEELARYRQQYETNKGTDQTHVFPLVDPSKQEIGQRVSAALPKINPVPIGTLTTAKGWKLCQDGQWVSRLNRIPTAEASTSPSQENYEGRALGEENFISYTVYNMSYDSKEYILLVWKTRYGSYRYPAISKEWFTYTVAEYWVLDKADFMNIGKVQDGQATVVTVKALVSNCLDLDQSLTAISKDIVSCAAEDNKKESLHRSYSNLNFVIMPSKEKNKVLFLLQGSSLRDYTLILTHVQKEKLGMDKSDKIFVESNKPTIDILRDKYYETPYTTFLGFIKLP